MIAIIAMLMGLLLPAVQGVREAGRRARCGNNLKQIGVAVVSFETARGHLPAGSSLTDSGHHWGGSWVAHILNYSDLAGVHRSLCFDRNNAFLSRVGCNDAVLTGFLPDWMFCPSSPLEKFKKTPPLWGGLVRGYGTYVGISGGYPDVGYPDPADDNKRVANVHEYNGFMASNGTLVPNGRLDSSAVLDGMSNTFLVGEQSGLVYDMDRGGEEADIRSAGGYGSFMGANRAGSPCSTCGSWMSGYPRAYNVTTIRHRLNSRTTSFAAGTGIPGNVGDGPNIPVQSAHPGGGQMLSGDGSVRFFRESGSFAVFKSQAIRDDGVNAGVILQSE